jgi:hypothetical protein
MISYHLNDAQKQFILKWLADNPKRPSFGAYDEACHQIGKLVTAAKPPAKAIPSARLGFSPGEFVPSSRFDAVKHLPPGWAAFNTHDSGNNHRVINAGIGILTALWNHWANAPDRTYSFRQGIVARGLVKQFEANAMEYHPLEDQTP